MCAILMLPALQASINICILASTKIYIFMKDINEAKASISERENQIINLLSSGFSEKEIADRLCISHKTVRNHMDNIRRKLCLSKNTEIIAYYVATLRNQPFSLTKLREYGIAAFLLFIHICKLDV